MMDWTIRIGRAGPATLTAVVAVMLLGLVGCGSDGSDGAGTKGVMATTPIWADIVAAVTCDRIEVESLAPPGSDSHDFELSMRGADRLLASRILFANGLDLETDLSAVFERAEESDVPVVMLGDELPAGSAIRSGDPHIWTDPANVATLVPVIEARLAGLDLMDRDELGECADQYSQRLDELVVEMTEILEPIPVERRKLVGEHRYLGHFADRFDFEVVGTMIDSSSSLAEADTRHLDDLRSTMRREDVNTVFIDVADSDAAATAFVTDVSRDGIVVPLYIETMPTDGADRRYPEMMRIDAERVAQALAE